MAGYRRKTRDDFDPGKWAENEAKKWLTERAKRADFQWHQYPDAYSTQGKVPAQPSDFLVAQRTAQLEWVNFVPGTVTHLEVKDTEQETRFPKSKLSQYGKLKLFALAGIRVRVLVHRSAFKDWVFFTEYHLFNHNEAPASFPFAGRPTFTSAAEALQRIFPSS